MIDAKGEEREPMDVFCRACDYKWVALYLPMELGKAAKTLKDMHCPMCGESSKRIAIDLRPPPAPT